MSRTYFSAMRDADLAEGSRLVVTLKGWPILICRNEGVIFAVINRCSHAASALADGRIRCGAIMCPLHGARFDLASGRCIGAAYPPLATFAVRVDHGDIQVEVPDEVPGAEHLPVRPL